MKRRTHPALTVSVFLVILISVVALLTGRSSWLEAFGFITGVTCVYLAAREHIGNWPIGLLTSGAYTFIFFEDRLFADAGLQVVYFVLGLLGWYWWLRGGVHKSEAKIARIPQNQWVPIIAISAIATYALTRYLASVGDAAPFLDAFTTVISLVAQYMLTRKYIENWLVWVFVDVIYVPLYLWKGLYLTGVLYAIFTVIAYLGLKEWNRLRSDAPVSVLGNGLAKVFLGVGAVVALVMVRLCYQLENGLPHAGAIRASASITVSDYSRTVKLSDEQLARFKAEALDPIKWANQPRRLFSSLATRVAFYDANGALIGGMSHLPTRYSDGKARWDDVLTEAFTGYRNRQ